MKRMLILPSAIRKMDIATLRAKATEMTDRASAEASPEQRQACYNTYVKITDEIDRRNAKVAATPLLVKKSSVYRMTAGELREQIAEMKAYGQHADPAWANTIALLEGEQLRRKAHDKAWYDKRKAEEIVLSS